MNKDIMQYIRRHIALPNWLSLNHSTLKLPLTLHNNISTETRPYPCIRRV